MKAKYIYLAIIAPLIVILDQWSKVWAVDELKSGRIIRVIEGFFNLRYVENRGAAWGLLANMDDSFRVPFFVGVSLVAIGFIMMLMRKVEPKQHFLAIALSLILGGAVGNFIDRIRLNYVVDFIDWYVKTHHWPTFNIADAGITVGVIMLILDMFLPQGDEAAAEAPAGAKPASGTQE